MSAAEGQSRVRGQDEAGEGEMEADDCLWPPVKKTAQRGFFSKLHDTLNMVTIKKTSI